MAKTTFIYHWWNDKQIKPYNDLCNPIIPSIAILRSQNRDVDIAVLDLSTVQRTEEDWGSFPEILNFKVVPWTPLMDRFMRGSRMCSRVWDVYAYAKQVDTPHIVFTDSDIFWLKNPLPLNMAKDDHLDALFCSYNTGVWYFDNRSPFVDKVFDAWKSVIAMSLIDDDFYERVRAVLPMARGSVFQDEIAFNYLMKHQHPEYFHTVPTEENHVIDGYRFASCDHNKIKCLHALYATLGSERGRICQLIEELAINMEKVLSKNQIQKIFGEQNVQVACPLTELRYLGPEDLSKLLSITKSNMVLEPTLHVPQNFK